MLPADVDAILREAETVELLSVVPLGAFPESEEVAASFHGTRILGRAVISDADAQQRIAGELRTRIQNWDGQVLRCVFDPHHAIIAKAGERVAEILICFECGDVEVYSDGKRRFLHIEIGAAASFDRELIAAGVPLAPRSREDRPQTPVEGD